MKLLQWLRGLYRMTLASPVEAAHMLADEGRYDAAIYAFQTLGRDDMVADVAMRAGEARVKAGSPYAAQSLFDLFFADMDRNLREMGISDMSVPKRIRSMVEAFYGRAGVYDAALNAAGAEGLDAALERNLFGGSSAQASLDAMAGYVVACEQALAKISGDALIAGQIAWPDIPAMAAAERGEAR